MAKSKKLDPTPDNKMQRPAQAGATMVDRAVHELVIGRLAEAGRIYWGLLHDRTRAPGGAGYSGADEIAKYFDCVFNRTDTAWDETLASTDWRVAYSKEDLQRYEKARDEEQREALERMLSDTRMYLSDRSNQKLAEAFGWLPLIRKPLWRQVVLMRMPTRTNSAGHRKPVYSWRIIGLPFGCPPSTVRHWHDNGIQDIVDGLARNKESISK
jgi:hypothetical protein